MEEEEICAQIKTLLILIALKNQTSTFLTLDMSTNTLKDLNKYTLRGRGGNMRADKMQTLPILIALSPFERK